MGVPSRNVSRWSVLGGPLGELTGGEWIPGGGGRDSRLSKKEKKREKGKGKREKKGKGKFLQFSVLPHGAKWLDSSCC